MGKKDVVLETPQHKGHQVPHWAPLLFSQNFLPLAATSPHILFSSLKQHPKNPPPTLLPLSWNIELSPQFASGIQKEKKKKLVKQLNKLNKDHLLLSRAWASQYHPRPVGFSIYPLPQKDGRGLKESAAKKIRFPPYNYIGEVTSSQ